MDIDEQLRAQSKLLLQKLKIKQGKLQNIVKCQPNESVDSLSSKPSGWHREKQQQENSQLDTSTTAIKHLKSTKLRHIQRNPEQFENSEKENFKSNYEKKELESKHISLDETALKDTNLNKKEKAENVKRTTRGLIKPQSFHYRTLEEGDRAKIPTYVPAKTYNGVSKSEKKDRRKVIDQNVRADSNLDDSELERSMNKSGLNFSYSNFDDSDLNFMRSRLNQTNDEASEDDEVVEGDEEYRERLRNAGNDKKVAKMIRESNKPKSILLTTGPKALKKSLNKVSFLTSKDSTGLNSDIDPDHTRHLLGYDWISGLLDNNRGTESRSESFFEELREFRRINRNECVNHAYMEGPESLFYDTADKEPELIQEVLQETKVKPYIVNDRLFTEPMKKTVFPNDDVGGDDDDSKPKKEPTQEEPRFVRVSIPRSTLLSPHRVKPHRRGSLENTDSFALSQHCMKGYENSVPSMMPAASNVGLRDASLGLKSKMQTTTPSEEVMYMYKTMADAENIASSFPYPWTTTHNDLKKPSLDRSSLYQSYMDMTLPHSMRSNIPGVGEESQKLKSATEDLLNSTYSLMYEMERMRKDRDISNSRLGRVS